MHKHSDLYTLIEKRLKPIANYMNNRNLEDFLTSVEGGYHPRSIHFHNGRISTVRPLS